MFRLLRKCVLLGEAAAILFYLRRILRIKGLGLVVTEIREQTQEPSAIDEPTALHQRLEATLSRLPRWMLGEAPCLLRSLTLMRMLARRGHYCRLLLQVPPLRQVPWVAHARVELCDKDSAAMVMLGVEPSP